MATASRNASAKGEIQVSIERYLNETFQPIELQVENESYKHNVPPSSESHFKVFIVSNKFEGLSLIQRHRLVQKCAARPDGSGFNVHALSIRALTDKEYANGKLGVQSTPNCKGGDGTFS